MVNVIGMGYIGLPTTLMMASHGIEVVGTDYNAERIASLKKKEVVFKEKGLEELMDAAYAQKLHFSTEYQKAEYYIIAVPTPYLKESKKIDPVYVVQAARQVLEVAPQGAVVILESTVSPGTMDHFVRPLLEEAGRTDLHLAHAPERIIPGNMVHELLHNSRTIGADSPEIAERVKALYASFCQGNFVLTDIKTAEMTKVVENTFRDINIAYANELARICRRDGMDVYEIIRIANMHPRVNILQPGPGVGGHCISVDPWFLVGAYPEQARLIRAAREINDGMPAYVLQRAADIMAQEGIHDVSRVGIYGLTYKENVDDVRESPTLQLLESMRDHLAAGVKVYDPFVQSKLVTDQYFDLQAFLQEVDLVIVMVGHREIVEKKDLLRDKVVLDTRNLFADGEARKVYKL